jgi:hypothetical protein
MADVLGVTGVCRVDPMAGRREPGPVTQHHRSIVAGGFKLAGIVAGHGVKQPAECRAQQDDFGFKAPGRGLTGV